MNTASIYGKYRVIALRQLVAISARLAHHDLDSAMSEITAKLNQDETLPPGGWSSADFLSNSRNGLTACSRHWWPPFSLCSWHR
ncbi:MAG: hypothetical protein KC588_07050 [Nitrospira sp.]|nr:hypothetical protein [Nitrospira sp.]